MSLHPIQHVDTVAGARASEAPVEAGDGGLGA